MLRAQNVVYLGREELQGLEALVPKAPSVSHALYLCLPVYEQQKRSDGEWQSAK